MNITGTFEFFRNGSNEVFYCFDRFDKARTYGEPFIDDMPIRDLGYLDKNDKYRFFKRKIPLISELSEKYMRNKLYYQYKRTQESSEDLYWYDCSKGNFYAKHRHVKIYL